MDRHLPDDLRLTEDQVRDIIERAARMPRRADITLDELRQIASELDLGSEALDQAIREVLSDSERKRTAHRWLGDKWNGLGRALGRLLPERHRVAAAGLLGGFLGWISAFAASWAPLVIGSIYIRPGGMALIDIPIAVAMIGMTLINSVNRRVDGRFARYVLETTAMWLTFCTVWSVLHGSITSDAARFTLVCVTALTAWGWFFVRRNDDHDPGELSAPAALPLPGADEVPPVDRPDGPEAWRGIVSPTLLQLMPAR